MQLLRDIATAVLAPPEALKARRRRGAARATLTERAARLRRSIARKRNQLAAVEAELARQRAEKEAA